MKDRKSVALKRRLQLYPSRMYHALFVAYGKHKEQSASSIGNYIIKDFFDRRPELVEALQREIKKSEQL